MNCCLVKPNGSCWFNQRPFFQTDKSYIMPRVDRIIPFSIALTERSETVLPEVVNNDVNWGPTEVSLSKSWTRNSIFFFQNCSDLSVKRNWSIYLVIEKKTKKHFNSVRYKQFLKQIAFYLVPGGFKLENINWDLETHRKS